MYVWDGDYVYILVFLCCSNADVAYVYENLQIKARQFWLIKERVSKETQERSCLSSNLLKSENLFLPLHHWSFFVPFFL